MNPHLAAVLAARSTVEAFPHHDGPIILQLVGRCALLSMAVENVEAALAFAEMLAPIAAAEGVILIADSYHQSIEQAEPPDLKDLPMRGDLARRFGEGDPTITEAILIHSAWREGRFELTICPYRRDTDDDGETVIEWLEGSSDTDDADEIDGRLPDALRHALASGSVFDEPEYMTESAEGMRMGTAMFMLNRLGMSADLVAREPDGDVDLRIVP